MGLKLESPWASGEASNVRTEVVEARASGKPCDVPTGASEIHATGGASDVPSEALEAGETFEFSPGLYGGDAKGTNN